MTNYVDNLELTPAFVSYAKTPIRVSGKRLTYFMLSVTKTLVGQCFVRLTSYDKNVLPRTAQGNTSTYQDAFTVMSGAAAVGLWVSLPVDIILEGPPYSMSVEAYSTAGAGETGQVQVTVITTDEKSYEDERLAELHKIVSLLGG